MQSNNAVEWQVVDYGSGIFHVASFQNGAASEAPIVVEAAPEVSAIKAENPARECFFYRCWVAMCDSRRAS